MTDGVVIVHPEWGIYLGSCLGLGFFSAMDCAGQDSAAVFPSEKDARFFIAEWSDNNQPDMFTYPTVQAVDTYWATIEELDAAGLAEWTIPLKAARMGEAAGGVQ
jgi:hypothetical protein